MKPWTCEKCGHELAVVDENGEAWLCERVILRPRSAVVVCPRCGAPNCWHMAPLPVKPLANAGSCAIL